MEELTAVTVFSSKSAGAGTEVWLTELDLTCFVLMQFNKFLSGLFYSDLRTEKSVEKFDC